MPHFSGKRSASLALLIASTLLSGAAFANEVAKVKSMSFKAYSATSPIHVISTDGKKWDKLRSENIGFSGEMSIDTRHPGFVSKAGVVLGGCSKSLCFGNPRVWSRQIGQRDWSGQGNFAFDTSVLPVSAGGIGGLSYGKEIIAACNAHLQADGPTKSHEFDTSMEATFVVNTGIEWGGSGQYGVFEASEGDFPDSIDYSRTKSFPVHVICDPVIKPVTNDIAIDQGEFKPEKIKLFLATFSGGRMTGRTRPPLARACASPRALKPARQAALTSGFGGRKGKGRSPASSNRPGLRMTRARTAISLNSSAAKSLTPRHRCNSWPKSSAIPSRLRRSGRTSLSAARAAAAG